jgi:hypothetical protein
MDHAASRGVVIARGERLHRVARHFKRWVACRIRCRLGHWLARLKGGIARGIMERFIRRIGLGGSYRIMKRIARGRFRAGHEYRPLDRCTSEQRAACEVVPASLPPLCAPAASPDCPNSCP